MKIVERQVGDVVILDLHGKILIGEGDARAGLKAGDVVTAVNGKAVEEPSELIEAVQAVEDGATLAIDYTRDKKAQSTKATLDKVEPSEQPRKRVSPI